MIIFFCKQRTAYEMRISDWSSDVCSSDLSVAATPAAPLAAPLLAPGLGRRRRALCLHLRVAVGIEALDRKIARRQIEPQMRDALGEMPRGFGHHVQHVAIGVIDADAPRVQMHLEADPAGPERLRPALFAVAEDRVAER